MANKEKMRECKGEKAVFDTQITLSYDDNVGSMFHSDVLGPTVDFLAAFIGNGIRNRHRTNRTAP